MASIGKKTLNGHAVFKGNTIFEKDYNTLSCFEKSFNFE
jgi:hypothetical protein